MAEQGKTGGVKEFLERLLALRVSEEERLRFAGDPLNVYALDYSNSRPLRVALILAVAFHVILFLVSLPFLRSQVLVPTQEVLVLKQLALPSLPKGGSPPQPEIPRPKPKPKPVIVPIPDPTPFEPEPIREEITLETPLVEEQFAELDIGDIAAPGRGMAGSGPGMSSGEGPAAGTGEGVYTLGSGVTPPELIVQTTPPYTDAAIKAKAQGTVLLQAIIRKDGRVTDFKVLRGLGFGLEERAIEEIASNWRFRPGTLNGRPVDVLATIEVTFTLR